MTSSFLRTLSLVVASVFLLESADAGKGVRKKDLRNFKGVYEGRLGGVVGETTAGEPLSFRAVVFDTAMRITTQSKLRVESTTGQVHKLVYRTPSGTPRRIRLIGRYVGRAWNPFKSTFEPVSGIRRLILIDRGKGKRLRYLANLKVDEMQEGTLSYIKVDGKLAQRK